MSSSHCIAHSGVASRPLALPPSCQHPSPVLGIGTGDADEARAAGRCHAGDRRSQNTSSALTAQSRQAEPAGCVTPDDWVEGIFHAVFCSVRPSRRCVLEERGHTPLEEHVPGKAAVARPRSARPRTRVPLRRPGAVCAPDMPARTEQRHGWEPSSAYTQARRAETPRRDDGRRHVSTRQSTRHVLFPRHPGPGRSASSTGIRGGLAHNPQPPMTQSARRLDGK